MESMVRTLLALFAAVSLFALGCAPPELEDQEALGETGSHQLAGTRLTPTQVAAHLRAAGFAESNIGKMVCTAKYESSYYTRATNSNRNGSTDRGLFQINSIHLGGGTKGCPSGSAALFDPATNAKCALAIFKAQGIRAWYGYRAHKSECDRTRAPAAGGSPAPADDDAAGPASPAGGDEDEAASDAATIDPDADYDLGAGCWSATKGEMMAPHACVQQASTSIWFQCKDGKWYRGGDDVTGPYGYCNGSFPLE